MTEQSDGGNFSMKILPSQVTIVGVNFDNKN